MMRSHLSYVFLPVWSVLASAVTPAIRPAPNQLDSSLVATAPLPGTSDSVIAFVDVSVLPMDQEKVLSNQTVLVQGGRITALGPVGQVDVPAGAMRIDSRGKFLLPGLADMHGHIFSGTHSGTYSAMGFPAYTTPVDMAGAEAKLFLWLANGVTTVRNPDLNNEEWGKQTLQLRALAAAGKSWIPHIYTSGPWGPERYIGGGNKPLALDSVAVYVAAYKAAGYDFIKVHDESPVVLDSVLAAAKRVGIPVIGHVPPPVTVEHVLPLGYKSIEHPLTEYVWNKKATSYSPDTAGIEVLAAAIRRAGVWHCPTQQHYERLHGNPTKLLKVEQDSGVKLLLGTDEGPWLGVITQELQTMVSAGLSPYQALLTGTRNVAEYFGTLDQRGTITVGKQADMVLLTGNPLQDIRYTAQPAGVMLGGRWLPSEEIQRHVAKLKLSIFADSDVVDLPVKSYWNNVVDRAMDNAVRMLNDIASYDTRQTAQKAQRKALVKSLGTSDQYMAGTQQVFSLIAKQLGEDRQAMSPDERATFDEKAKRWIQRRAEAGYSVTIPGVQ